MNNTTRNWKTTLTGAAIIGGYLLNAIATYLKTGAFPDMTEASLALTTGWGFIMAKDASTTGVIRVLLLAPACLMLSSCGTMPDGTKTFAGLTKADWALVSKDASQAAIKSGAQAGLISYGARRAITAAKNPVNVTP